MPCCRVNQLNITLPAQFERSIKSAPMMKEFQGLGPLAAASTLGTEHILLLRVKKHFQCTLLGA